MSPYQSGHIVRVRGIGPLRQRMMDMGMVPGAEIKVVRVAPLGDPIEYELKGYHLSLRHREAQHILVDVNIMTLEQIQPPATVKLIDVHGGRHFQQRMKSMGLKPGQTLKIIKNIPNGPIIIRVATREVQIGQGMANKLLVEPLAGIEE